jgi:hypothetical protein
MKKSLFFLLFLSVLYSCNDKSTAPDVSGISVSIPVIRFDQDFFRIDTNDLSGGLRQLQQKHPGFYIDFMQNILGVSGADTNQQTLTITREFIRGYAPVQEVLDKKFKTTTKFQKELEQAFRYVKHYFPQYKTSNAIFFTGPFDAPGVANTNAGFAFGLQQYAGKDFAEYQAPVFQEMFPTYISRRFSPEYMVTNCMKSVSRGNFSRPQCRQTPDRTNGRKREAMVPAGQVSARCTRFIENRVYAAATGLVQGQ